MTVRRIFEGNDELLQPLLQMELLVEYGELVERVERLQGNEQRAGKKLTTAKDADQDKAGPLLAAVEQEFRDLQQKYEIASDQATALFAKAKEREEQAPEDYKDEFAKYATGINAKKLSALLSKIIPRKGVVEAGHHTLVLQATLLAQENRQAWNIEGTGEIETDLDAKIAKFTDAEIRFTEMQPKIVALAQRYSDFREEVAEYIKGVRQENVPSFEDHLSGERAKTVRTSFALVNDVLKTLPFSSLGARLEQYNESIQKRVKTLTFKRRVAELEKERNKYLAGWTHTTGPNPIDEFIPKITALKGELGTYHSNETGIIAKGDLQEALQHGAAEIVATITDTQGLLEKAETEKDLVKKYSGIEREKPSFSGKINAVNQNTEAFSKYLETIGTFEELLVEKSETLGENNQLVAHYTTKAEELRSQIKLLFESTVSGGVEEYITTTKDARATYLKDIKAGKSDPDTDTVKSMLSSFDTAVKIRADDADLGSSIAEMEAETALAASYKALVEKSKKLEKLPENKRKERLEKENTYFEQIGEIDSFKKGVAERGAATEVAAWYEEETGKLYAVEEEKYQAIQATNKKKAGRLRNLIIGGITTLVVVAGVYVSMPGGYFTKETPTPSAVTKPAPTPYKRTKQVPEREYKAPKTQKQPKALDYAVKERDAGVPDAGVSDTGSDLEKLTEDAGEHPQPPEPVVKPEKKYREKKRQKRKNRSRKDDSDYTIRQ